MMKIKRPNLIRRVGGNYLWCNECRKYNLWGGIPHVLGLNPNDEATVGFQLIVFGATYYASYAYTANMDLPIGRSYMQTQALTLGFSQYCRLLV